MKNRPGLRFLAVCAAAAVLLTASFGRQASNAGCSEDDIQRAVFAALPTVRNVLVTRSGNSFTVTIAVAVSNDDQKRETIRAARKAASRVAGCAVDVDSRGISIICPSDAEVIEGRVRKYWEKFLPACATAGITKITVNGNDVALKGTVPAGKLNPDLDMTYLQAVVEAAQAAICGKVDSNKLTARAPGSADCVVRFKSCPKCPEPQCPPGFSSCMDSDGNIICIEGPRCPIFN
ncbi:MAG TPA: hypothetical protein VKA60_02075 [Blastocatellia bacterium]|nr:hypothetical protein [Blastocatellia bacterium]